MKVHFNNKNFQYLVILYLLINIFHINKCFSKKQYVYKQYQYPDCTGELYYQRALIASNEYCFRTLWFHFAKLTCERSSMGNKTDADCYVSENCDCDSDDCKIYYKFDECINGTKIVHERVNYIEKDYCVISEGNNPIQIGKYKPDGVSVVIRDKCFEGTKMDCDLLDFVFIDCETNMVLDSSPTLSLAIQLTPYGNISFYLGELGFLTAPTYYGNSNSILNNHSLFLNNFVLLFIILFLTFINY
ncbi:hypothetical protein DDB_G0288033 [Dictyostelium discoideum AX4]|uniref:Uncharacterized protein n=1 Tax=Dictyostelium discoideum TaxID=44689 RepID=Q54JI3_DICDI|nr:hypothetical protein DDB_G0288033 [Dictyostelium discoideum AX4]EAL63442.1 hypothetical protein DDB_G0288033 [Dictyostelium discoideum AX4]|eukprot:XP_636948.1 hypothetical protein DDB_G0288033 [Dictyostelium discoideum AX4]